MVERRLVPKAEKGPCSGSALRAAIPGTNAAKTPRCGSLASCARRCFLWLAVRAIPQTVPCERRSHHEVKAQPWFMRRRTQAAMDELVGRAGFIKRSQEIDKNEAFSPCRRPAAMAARRRPSLKQSPK